MHRLWPIVTVLGVILVLWYAAVVWMNAPWVQDQAARAKTTVSFAQLVPQTMNLDRPVLPAPHQVAAELGRSVFGLAVTSKKSLVYHAWVTISATLLGFAMGTAFGILLAVGIIHNRAMDQSVMPWAIASQTIPILAIAPMIIVVLSSLGVQGLVPKAIISAFLSFFPVLVGMVKGLQSPDAMQLDLMQTWNASGAQGFWKLRLPASLPYLFASLKVAIAAALVGAIVGELPTGAIEGLGARMLIGSQFGEPLIMWAALVAAAVLAGGLIVIVGLLQTIVGRRLGTPA